jgi:hypothetical protein
MIITVKLRFEDSVAAEEASGRTGQPLPSSMDVQIPGYLMNVPLTEAWAQDIAYDELSEKVAEMLTKLGMGGLEFELVD